MRAKDKSNVVKVGIFVAALTAVLMVFVVTIGKENSLFEPKVILKAHVTNAANLKTGAVVELKGLRVGDVESVQIIDVDKVEVLIRIREADLRWIRQDGKVAINNAGLVGDKYLEITGGTSEAPPFNIEKDILYSEPALDFKQIMGKGETIADTTARILTKVDAMFTAMGDGKDIAQMVNSLNRSAQSLERVTGQMATVNLGKTFASLDSAAARMDRIMTRVEKGPGTVNSLVYDDGLYDDLRALLGGAERNKVIKFFIRESIKKSKEQN